MKTVKATQCPATGKITVLEDAEEGDIIEVTITHPGGLLGTTDGPKLGDFLTRSADTLCEVISFNFYIMNEELKKTILSLKCDQCSGSGARSTPSSFSPCSDCVDGSGFILDGNFNDIFDKFLTPNPKL